MYYTRTLKLKVTNKNTKRHVFTLVNVFILTFLHIIITYTWIGSRTCDLCVEGGLLSGSECRFDLGASVLGWYLISGEGKGGFSPGEGLCPFPVMLSGACSSDRLSQLSVAPDEVNWLKIVVCRCCCSVSNQYAGEW